MNVPCNTNGKNRKATVLYTLETRVFRYKIVNTLQKGDNKNDDDDNNNNNNLHYNTFSIVSNNILPS